MISYFFALFIKNIYCVRACATHSLFLSYTYVYYILIYAYTHEQQSTTPGQKLNQSSFCDQVARPYPIPIYTTRLCVIWHSSTRN